MTRKFLVEVEEHLVQALEEQDDTKFTYRLGRIVRTELQAYDVFGFQHKDVWVDEISEESEAKSFSSTNKGHSNVK